MRHLSFVLVAAMFVVSLSSCSQTGTPPQSLQPVTDSNPAAAAAPAASTTLRPPTPNGANGSTPVSSEGRSASPSAGAISTPPAATTQLAATSTDNRVSPPTNRSLEPKRNTESESGVAGQPGAANAAADSEAGAKEAEEASRTAEIMTALAAASVPPTNKSGTEPGDTIPEIEGKDLDGERFALSDYEGKVLMIDFWGDW